MKCIYAHIMGVTRMSGLIPHKRREKNDQINCFMGSEIKKKQREREEMAAFLQCKNVKTFA